MLNPSGPKGTILKWSNFFIHHMQEFPILRVGEIYLLHLQEDPPLDKFL